MDQILGISTVVTDDAGQRSRPIYRKMPGHKEIQLFRKDPPAPTVGSVALQHLIQLHDYSLKFLNDAPWGAK